MHQSSSIGGWSRYRANGPERKRERERERESVCVCERGRRKERERDREMLRDGYQRVTGGERRVDSGSSGEHEGVNVGVEGEFKAA